jgi:hypothetical protein
MFRRLWFFVTRWRRMQDLDEEMRLHVELRAAANRRDGLHAEEAARQARLRFGNPLKLREDARDVWGFAEVERISGDLRHAVRRIGQHPGRTLIVVLTLALGIGATTAMFMLLKPAPWNRSGRVVWIAGLKGRSADARNVSYPDYLVYRDRATTLSGIAAEGGTAMAIEAGSHSGCLADSFQATTSTSLGCAPRSAARLRPMRTRRQAPTR